MRTLTIEILNDMLKRSKNRELIEEKFLVTPKIAKHILAVHNYSNRPVTYSWVESYARDMVSGGWNQSTGNTLKFSKTGEFIDGQHRLLALIESNTPRVFTFKFGLDENAKAAIDIGKPRSTIDIQGLLLPTSKNRTKKSAVASIIYGFINNPANPHSHRANHKPSNPEIVALILKYNDKIDDIIAKFGTSGIDKVVIETYAIFAYLVLSNTKYAHLVDNFFEKFASGANLNSDDPIFVVHKRLVNDRLYFRNQGNKDRALALIFKAWNMHINNDKASNKMKTPEEIPVIAGLDSFDGINIYNNV